MEEKTLEASVVQKVFEPFTCGICKASLAGFSYTLLGPKFKAFVENVVTLVCGVAYSKSQCQTVTDAYVALVMDKLKAKTFEPDYF